MTRYEETVAERPLEEHIGEVWRPPVGSYEEVMMYVRENIDEARHIKGFSLAFNSFFRLSHIENPDVYSDEMLGYMAGELLKLCENNFKFYLRTLRYLPTSDIRFSYPVEDMVKYALKGIAIKYPGVSPVNIPEDFAKVESTEVFQEVNFKLWVLYMKGYSSVHRSDLLQEIAYLIKQSCDDEVLSRIKQDSNGMVGEARRFVQNLIQFL